MINLNGEIISNNKATLSVFNRGLAYGDGLFETIKVNGTQILFWEDHYFRLMSSMRIMRMRIPMNFTLEYLEKQILDTVASSGVTKQQSLRVKVTVFRDSDGMYAPKTNAIGFFISVSKINTLLYPLNFIKNTLYEIELYKDHTVAKNLLSTLKTNNRAINVLASIFAKENSFDNLLLLNTDKKVIEAINGNLFIVNGLTIKTPPTSDGCINGILKQQLIKLLKNDKELTIIEDSISAFELQKADELFITNVIKGITSVSKYRKKTYTNGIAKKVLDILNTSILSKN